MSDKMEHLHAELNERTEEFGRVCMSYIPFAATLSPRSQKRLRGVTHWWRTGVCLRVRVLAGVLRVSTLLNMIS